MNSKKQGSEKTKTNFHAINASPIFELEDLEPLIKKFNLKCSSDVLCNELNDRVLTQVQFTLADLKNSPGLEDERPLIEGMFKQVNELMSTIDVLLMKYGRETVKLLVNDYSKSAKEIEQGISAVYRLLNGRVLPALKELQGKAIIGKHNINRSTPTQSKKREVNIAYFKERLVSQNLEILEFEDSNSGYVSDPNYQDLLSSRAETEAMLKGFLDMQAHIEATHRNKGGNSRASPIHVFIDELAVLYYKKSGNIPDKVAYDPYAEEEIDMYKGFFLDFVWDMYEILVAKHKDGSSLHPHSIATIAEILERFEVQKKTGSTRSRYLSLRKKIADIIRSTIDKIGDFKKITLS